MAETTEAIRKSASERVMMMSLKKIEIMPISRHSQKKKKKKKNPTLPLGDDGNIKVIDHFKYLSATAFLMKPTTTSNFNFDMRCQSL